MRRGYTFTRLTIAAACLLAMTASPALAAKPEKSPLEGFTVTFPAGVLCDFSVEWSIAAGGNQLVFPERRNGDVVVRSVGRARGTVTNLDSGPELSVRFRGGIRQDLVFHADGTLDAIINGTVLAGYFPTDVGGPSMWLFRGHLHDRLDATFTATAHSFSGNATDLCAALTPPQ
jgi:hypothetical protein